MQTSVFSNPTSATLLVAVIIVVRFALRELRPRVVKRAFLWIRPGFLAVMTVLVIALGIVVPGSMPLVLAGAVAVGGVLGAITGTAVVRLSSFAPTGTRGQVRVSVSWKTAAVWIVAVLFRVGAHLFVPRGNAAASLALNAGLLMLIAVAFIVVAVGFHRAMDRTFREASA